MSALVVLLITPLVAGFASLGLRRFTLLHAVNLMAMLSLALAEAWLAVARSAVELYTAGGRGTAL